MLTPGGVFTDYAPASREREPATRTALGFMPFRNRPQSGDRPPAGGGAKHRQQAAAELLVRVIPPLTTERLHLYIGNS